MTWLSFCCSSLMGVCQEPGVTVLIAIGIYAAYNLSVVVFYSCSDAHILLLSLLIWWSALWDDLGAGADVGKVEVLLLSGPSIGFDLKERNPCLPGTIWSEQSVRENIMLLPLFLSCSHPSCFVMCCFHLVLCYLEKSKAQMCPESGAKSVIKKSGLQTLANVVSLCRADLKSWLSDLAENRDSFMDLEFASVASNSVTIKHHNFRFLCIYKGLCRKIAKIQILRNRHSNVSSLYICYEWIL